MKKTVSILIVSMLITIKVLAQGSAPSTQNYTNGKNNAAMVGIDIPAGEFFKTHIAGINLNYSWSHHRFGKLQALPEKLIGFTADGGMAYYFGKKETIAGYGYRYGGYIYLHAFCGAIYNPCKKGNITLTTGPVLGIYKGSAEPGLGINLNGGYSLTDKIAITPGIGFLKQKDVAAHWAFIIGTAWSF